MRSVVAVPVLLLLAPVAALVRHALQPDVIVYGFWGSPEAAVLMVAAWAAGALALVLGVVALLRRDRSALVLLAVAVGWVVTTFGVGEVLVPH